MYVIKAKRVLGDGGLYYNERLARRNHCYDRCVCNCIRLIECNAITSQPSVAIMHEVVPVVICTVRTKHDK